jgi:hypothetical protein
LIVYNKVCVGSCHPARPTLYVIYAWFCICMRWECVWDRESLLIYKLK